jgi:hypothetical protein
MVMRRSLGVTDKQMAVGLKALVLVEFRAKLAAAERATDGMKPQHVASVS